MLAVSSMCLGGLLGVALGTLAARRTTWRPSQKGWLLVLGLMSYGLISEVWFVFIYLRRDVDVRSDPTPLAFYGLWTAALVGVGVWASLRRIQSRKR